MTAVRPVDQMPRRAASAANSALERTPSFVKTWMSEGVGILLAEHDDRALRIAQRSIVMESGRIKV